MRSDSSSARLIGNVGFHRWIEAVVKLLQFAMLFDQRGELRRHGRDAFVEVWFQSELGGFAARNAALLLHLFVHQQDLTGSVTHAEERGAKGEAIDRTFDPHSIALRPDLRGVERDARDRPSEVAAKRLQSGFESLQRAQISSNCMSRRFIGPAANMRTDDRVLHAES